MATDTLQGRAYAAAIGEPPEQPAAASGAAPPVATIAQVYDAHGDYVFRCLRGLGVRADMIDDAFQDAFMVVQDKLDRFDGRSKLQTWLYAIVLRVARRYRERAARDAVRFVATEPASAHGAEEQHEHNEQLALARRALDALDDAKREVFVLAVIEQMSAPEIAAVLDIPLNTVYSRLRLARGVFAAEVARLQSGQKSRRYP